MQTLSRLNRIATGKEDTFVLDFINDPDQILKAFRQYYRGAELAGVTDPNLVHDLQTKLDDARVYLATEVDTVRVVEAEQDFDLTELSRLEARRRDETIAKREEIAGGEGFDDVEVRDRLPEDRHDAAKRADRAGQAIVGDG